MQLGVYLRTIAVTVASLEMLSNRARIAVERTHVICGS